MNATTNAEQTALTEQPASQLNALALITLSPEKFAAEVYQPFKDQLASAIDSVRAVDYDITTTAGMAVAVKCRATFRNLRVDADKERKARKEPITKIGKLLESGYDQVEERIAPLEELFDADIKAEEQRKEDVKQAKIAEERLRMEKIIDAMKGIRERETDVVLKTKTAAEALAEIDCLTALEITEDVYQERLVEARILKASTLEAMCAIHASRVESEAATLAAEQARLAEVARIEAEKIALAAQKAENARIAAEQAKEAQRLSDLAAQQQAAILAQQKAAEAKAQAERDAQAKVAAEAKRQMEAQQAVIAEQSRKLAEQQAAADARDAAAAAVIKAAEDAAIAKAQDDARREDDHGPALLMNAEFDAAREAERVRLQNLHSEAVADLVSPEASVEDLADSIADELDPTNEEIEAMGAECGLTQAQWVERLDAYVMWARAEHPEVAA